MVGRKRGETPFVLARAARRFSVWRSRRQLGTRIPRSFWTAAVKLAARCGVHQTARALRLDYYSLKKRVDEETPELACAGSSSPPPTFVELAASTLAAAPGECVIEFEKPEGSRMRVHLKGVNTPDLVALGTAFWSAE